MEPDFPHEVLPSYMGPVELRDVLSRYTDVYLSGPGLKAKRMLDGAKLPKWSLDVETSPFCHIVDRLGAPCASKL